MESIDSLPLEWQMVTQLSYHIYPYQCSRRYTEEGPAMLNVSMLMQ